LLRIIKIWNVVEKSKGDKKSQRVGSFTKSGYKKIRFCTKSGAMAATFTPFMQVKKYKKWSEWIKTIL